MRIVIDSDSRVVEIAQGNSDLSRFGDGFTIIEGIKTIPALEEGESIKSLRWDGKKLVIDRLTVEIDQREKSIKELKELDKKNPTVAKLAARLELIEKILRV